MNYLQSDNHFQYNFNRSQAKIKGSGLIKTPLDRIYNVLIWVIHEKTCMNSASTHPIATLDHPFKLQ